MNFRSMRLFFRMSRQNFPLTVIVTSDNQNAVRDTMRKMLSPVRCFVRVREVRFNKEFLNVFALNDCIESGTC